LHFSLRHATAWRISLDKQSLFVTQSRLSILKMQLFKFYDQFKLP
jgi:hypothetical protein